jgi:hypothetical protein
MRRAKPARLAAWLGKHEARNAEHRLVSRVYYGRKRTEGKTHTQAIPALARRRLNALWVMLRDNTF